MKFLGSAYFCIAAAWFGGNTAGVQWTFVGTGRRQLTGATCPAVLTLHLHNAYDRTVHHRAGYFGPLDCECRAKGKRLSVTALPKSSFVAPKARLDSLP